ALCAPAHGTKVYCSLSPRLAGNSQSHPSQSAPPGRSVGRVLSGGAPQRIAENTLCRVQTLFGERRWARGLKPHHPEALVKGSGLNRMPQLGMPETVRVEYSPSFEEGSIGAVLHCPTKPLTDTSWGGF